MQNGKNILGWTIRLLALGVIGVGLGMAARVWIVPRLSTAEQAGHGGDKNRGDIVFWKSSMIPNFVSPQPGMDPMGMELVPVYVNQLSEEKLITLSHETMRNMGLRTTPVVSGTAERVVRTVGQVDYAEPLLGDVTLKVNGWIEKLHVDYLGQRVRKGEPLFSLYSPDLVTAQIEYLVGLPEEGDKPRPGGARDLLGQQLAPRDRLRYWDVPESELAAIKRSGRAKKAVTFVSPFDGWVIDKSAFEGMYMKAGTRFYRIAGLSRMWVYVYIYEFQLPWVREGQLAHLTLPYDPGKTLQGKVVYVYPFVDPRTRQVRVRLEFPNPKLELKPEMYANVEIATNPEQKQLLVPLDAVIYTGRHQDVDGVSRRVGRAFVELSQGKFEPREVVLGEEAEGGLLQVLSGLKAGERVVVTAQFELEGERKVKEANLKMLTQAREGKEPAATPKGHHH